MFNLLISGFILGKLESINEKKISKLYKKIEKKLLYFLCINKIQQT